ncbi:hypothetical protein C8Q80DRAFT_1117750 [Daedaleopsis nitida]|nr:hypothetical protein C8Q80DRAFT_1117750 [Daedaleopsis nitida]
MSNGTATDDVPTDSTTAPSSSSTSSVSSTSQGNSTSTDPPTTTPSTTTDPPTTDPTTTTPTDTPTDTTPTSTSSTTTPSDTSTPTDSTSSPTSTPPPTSSSDSTSPTPTPSTVTQTSVVTGTDSNGQQFTSVVTSTVVSTPSLSANDRSTSSSSSKTGPIVGGVVGGIAGLAILATLVFFLFRRHRKRDDFDGNFDPDRVVGLSGDNRGTLPNIDLAADNITPYNYTPQGPGMPVAQHATGSSMTGGGAPDMRQYGGGQVPAFLAGGLAGGAAGAAMAHGGRDGRGSPPSSYSQPGQSYYAQSASEHGAYPDYSAYNQQHPQNRTSIGSATGSPTSTTFGPQVAGVPGRDFRHPSPGPSLAHTSYTDPSTGSGGAGGPGVIPSMKEREALGYRSGNLSVANPDGAGPSGVLQHMDGGRLDATPEEEPTEVPPRYDTIPRD